MCLSVSDCGHTRSCLPLLTLQNFDEDVSVEVLMERMRQLHEEQSEASQEELIKRFEKVEIQSVECKSLALVIPGLKCDVSEFIQCALLSPIRTVFSRKNGMTEELVLGLSVSQSQM